MGTVANLINDKNVRIKTASITLIFLIASISIWGMYGSSVLGLVTNHNNNIGTTFHRIIVNIAGQEVMSRIEPLNLAITDSSYGCSSCGNAQNQTGLVSTNGIINSTIQERSESRIVTLMAYRSNNTISKATVTIDILWNYNEYSGGINRTASFLSMGMIPLDPENKPIQFYVLIYFVQHVDYTLAMYTSFTKTYNFSSTVLDYVPAGESGLKAGMLPLSLEVVKFNSPVTLSQNYRVLGKVAGEMGRLYSMNETFAYLAERYRTIEVEAEHLAKLVSLQLQGYDRIILRNIAIVSDGCTYDSDCSYIGQGYVCLGSSCGPCFSCSQPSQCVSQFGQGWTCYQGCCRQPGYQPPSCTGCKVMNYQCQQDCNDDWCIYAPLAICTAACLLAGPGLPLCDTICSLALAYGCAVACYNYCCIQWCP